MKPPPKTPSVTPASDAAPVEPEPRRSRLGLVLWLSFLFLVVYPLSIGPACWLWDKGWLPERALYFYAPFSLFAEKCPPVKRFFDWYIEKLWRRAGPPK